MEIIEADVVIIGGGPAGCTCALYTSRSNLKTVILDKNPSVGALAITHQIANYPGVPVDISGEKFCLLYTSPSPRDSSPSRMPSSA